MAEETEPPIATDQLAAFVDAKSADKPCEACGSETWSVPDPHNEAVLYVKADTDKMYGRRYVPVLTIFCENCGLIRAFSANLIRKWLREQESGIE